MTTTRRLQGALLGVGIASSLVGGAMGWVGAVGNLGTSTLFIAGWALIALGALCVISLIVIGETTRHARPHRHPPPGRQFPPPVTLPKGLEAPPPGHTWVVTVRENAKRRK